MKFYGIQNLFWLGHISLLRNTKNKHITMEEEGLGNLLALNRYHQKGSKQFRSRELHCWGLDLGLELCGASSAALSWLVSHMALHPRSKGTRGQ